jgi:hypothetical protein
MFGHKQIEDFKEDAVGAIYKNKNVMAAINRHKKFDARKDMSTSIRRYLN